MSGRTLEDRLERAMRPVRCKCKAVDVTYCAASEAVITNPPRLEIELGLAAVTYHTRRKCWSVDLSSHA